MSEIDELKEQYLPFLKEAMHHLIDEMTIDEVEIGEPPDLDVPLPEGTRAARARLACIATIRPDEGEK